MILQCAVRAATQSADTATGRTRDLLDITNAQHGAGAGAILVSSAGQQADGVRSGRVTAPQMPLRGRPSHRLSIRNMRVTWWSYGDSNSGPLACHQQAPRPQRCICAGQRPRACTPIRPGPGRLRYFRAVLPRRSAGVHGRCGTPLAPSRTWNLQTESPRNGSYSSADVRALLDELARSRMGWRRQHLIGYRESSRGCRIE
jgi:hypothetical protein